MLQELYNLFVNGVSGESKIIKITPTLDTNAHIAKDVIVADHVINLKTRKKIKGYLMGISIVDTSNQAAAMTIMLSREPLSPGAQNAEFAPTAANLANVIRVINIAATDYVTIGTSAPRVVADIDIPAKLLESNCGIVYVNIQSEGTPTYAADALTIRFDISLEM